MNKILRVCYLAYTKILSVLNIETTGVRVILVKDAKILLVKTRYYPYWILPGGGIKKGESIQAAAIREVEEECGATVHSFTNPLGRYENGQEGRRDTVTVLIAGLWDTSRDKKRPWNFEIQKSEFFDVNNLPQAVSTHTKRRIEEYLTGKRGFTGTW